MGTKLTRAEVANRLRVSVRTIIRWGDDPRYTDLNFPRPVKLGLRRQLYDSDELEAWEKERKAQSLDDLDLDEFVPMEAAQ
jgi:predicted DNA-binding transcriptional regulator AlpA